MHACVKPRSSTLIRAHREELCALSDAGGAALLADGVHAQCWPPNVHRAHAQTRRQHGPDGRATGTVIAYYHILGRAESESVECGG